MEILLLHFFAGAKPTAFAAGIYQQLLPLFMVKFDEEKRYKVFQFAASAIESYKFKNAAIRWWQQAARLVCVAHKKLFNKQLPPFYKRCIP